MITSTTTKEKAIQIRLDDSTEIMNAVKSDLYYKEKENILTDNTKKNQKIGHLKKSEKKSGYLSNITKSGYSNPASAKKESVLNTRSSPLNSRIKKKTNKGEQYLLENSLGYSLVFDPMYSKQSQLDVLMKDNLEEKTAEEKYQ